MAFHIGSDDERDDALLNTINTTPLVDVMLVLLIIFLITIPVVTTSVKVALPNEPLQPMESRPDSVIVSVTAQGQSFWYDTPLPHPDALRTRLQTVAQRQPQPELHVRADAQADFVAVAQVLSAAQAAGLHKVKFLTDPRSGAAPSAESR